ncbi:MAG TPA: hypothetical protein RMH99_03015 [Sandaracinaceae bacterium LLY-WYZ-13_1]|nr:hypothetical protein [Sandaracinaceae bacterium LLY-WYZ-13_1]
MLLLASLPGDAWAQPRDPTLEWRTIDTPNFTIHYHIPLGVLARRVAAVSERAHAVLSDVMGYEANRRTHVVLSDGTDSANGSATALPFNTIRLFASAPSSMSPLNDYDDWLNLLVTHEHTHIVHLDQWSGVASFINILLGKVYAPNHVQPRWILEGIATWQESERTSGGRLRSSMFDMYLRMDALEDRFFDIDQMSNIADRWPHGNVWYLYGSQFVAYVVRQHGREAIARIAREYGGETIPWGINRVARRATGRGWVELYDDFLADRRAHYEAQRDAVIASGRVEGERLTHHGELARLPRFDPEGRVMYWRDDNRTRPRVMRFSLEDPDDQETLARVNGDAGYDLHPSGRVVVHSRIDNFRDIYSFHDLFRRDLETGRTDRLTTGMRARDPDVSPDGRRVAFTVNGAGTTHLMIAELRDVEGTARRLLENERFEQVFNPRFSPDGRTVAIERWQAGGYRDIQLVDVQTGRVTPITHDRAQDMTPSWSRDGETLYFTSDRTGIANVYAHDMTSGTLRQITNVVAGAYAPAVSPDGSHLVYVGYTSYGFDLFHLDLREVRTRPAPPYVDRRPPPAASMDDLWNGPSRDYQPLETLYPRAYLLELTNDGFGTALGINVEGEDLARWHRWRLRATTGFERGNTNVDLFYSYGRMPLRISARFFRRLAPRGGLRIADQDRTWVEEAIGGELSLSYRLPRSFRSQTVSLTWRGTHLDNAEPVDAALDPNESPPELPNLGFRSELRLSWSYSDVERYGYDISPSNGRAFGFTLSVAHPSIGSEWTAVGLTWFVRQYLRMPWLQHHVLALHYAGGISGGDVGRRGTYAVGGFPEVNPIDGLVNGLILGGVALRGYPAFDRSGTQYHLVQAEYRFPIWRINRGVLTLPVYLNRLSATVFADVGDAFYDRFDIERFRVGVSAELLLDFTIGYLLAFTLRVGYARGLMEGGIDQVYGHIGVPF